MTKVFVEQPLVLPGSAKYTFSVPTKTQLKLRLVSCSKPQVIIPELFKCHLDGGAVWAEQGLPALLQDCHWGGHDRSGMQLLHLM